MERSRSCKFEEPVNIRSFQRDSKNHEAFGLQERQPIQSPEPPQGSQLESSSRPFIDFRNMPRDDQFVPFASFLGDDYNSFGDDNVITVLREMGKLLDISCQSLGNPFEFVGNLVYRWERLVRDVPQIRSVHLDEFLFSVTLYGDSPRGRETMRWIRARLRVSHGHAYMLVCLARHRQDHMQWFSDLVARQPVYTDLPSDFVVPDPVEHLEDPFRVLSQLIREFNEQSSLKVIVYEISKIALSVAQLYIDSDGLPPEAFIRALEDDVVRDFSILVSNPLGDGSLELRKAMSSINVRSLVRLLLHYLRVQDREHRTLCYTVHRTIVIQAIAALDNPAHRTRFIDLVVDHNELNWGHLLIGGIVEWWAPFDFQRVWLDGADEDDAGEDGIDEDAGNLGLETTSGIYNEEPDLEFFASLVTTNSGEECAICQDLLSDDTYGVPMKLNVCSHVFHHDCILKHVKGTASYSNKCPMCREEIYHSRERAHCEYKKLT